jgi:hypothetical protein
MSDELTPEDKKLYLKDWGLKEGDLTDEEILMVIKLGQL